MDVSLADNSVKNWRNLPIGNPKQDLHNINAHTTFGENPSKFTRYRPETTIQTDGRQPDKKTDGYTDNQHDTMAGYKTYDVYSFEAPRRGASNGYHNICFYAKIKQISQNYH